MEFTRLVDWLSPTITTVMFNESWLGTVGFAQHLSDGGNNGADAHLSLLLRVVLGACDGLPNILGNCGGCFLTGYCCQYRYRDHDGLGSRLQFAAWFANGCAARGVVLVPVADALNEAGLDIDPRAIKARVRTWCWTTRLVRSNRVLSSRSPLSRAGDAGHDARLSGASRADGDLCGWLLHAGPDIGDPCRYPSCWVIIAGLVMLLRWPGIGNGGWLSDRLAGLVGPAFLGRSG